MSKLPPGLDNAINHSYLDALYERRSRRFPMGGEIDEGPLKYKSKHSPVPLSEIEEAILAWNGLGIKNINLSDFPPHKGLDLEVKFMSKTIPSLGDIHRTELFYTNDEGLYLLKLNDKDAPDLKGIEGLKYAKANPLAAVVAAGQLADTIIPRLPKPTPPKLDVGLVGRRTAG